MASERRHTIDEDALKVTSVFAGTGEHAVLDHSTSADEEVLGALGYKQEFKRYAIERLRPAVFSRNTAWKEPRAQIQILEISPSGPPSPSRFLS